MNEITITNKNGVLTVSSLQVAKDFGKRHDNLVRDIENLINNFSETSILRFQKSDENSSNLTPQNWGVKNFFIESTYKTKGNNKTYKCYDMTRDGFSLLVMGFTGQKALEWKLKYIEAFNSMERQLTNINSNIEAYIDCVLDKKIESVINRVLDEKINDIVKILDKNDKNAERRMNSIIKSFKETVEKTSCETINTLIPCFLYTHKKLKKLYKKLKK